MKEFEVGKTYEMETIEIRQDDRSGKDFIALRDDTCDTYRVYNILKFQYDSLSDKINVIVKDLDVMGRPKLKQDVGDVYSKIYKFGETYDFKIIDIKQDIFSPVKAEYYEIEDELCVHRCYFREQLHDIGDTCAFFVEGLTNSGDLKIKEIIEKTTAETIVSVTPISEEEKEPDNSLTYPVLDLGEESTTLEYKTSIVFKNGEANIDEQLFVIVKTLVAFMNAQGGDLYIGIHDKTRRVVGISKDLEHLNEGEDDYNGQYEPTVDKYQLKIRHALERLSQGVAGGLVEFEFPECKGVQYCHIRIKAAKRPVWVRGNLLFQRTGNRITLLKKDEITNFVYERIRIPIKDIIDTEGLNEATMTPEKIAQVVKLVTNAHRKAIAAPQTSNDFSKVEYYVVWYQDGTWKRVRDTSSEQNAYYILPVRKTDTEGRLVFCYDSGCVNEVKFSDFRKGANLNELKKDGFCTKEKPKHILLVNTNNLLAVYSSDEHGIEYVKVHRITDINPTKGAKNQGSLIIPRGGNVLSYKLVSGEYETNIRPLIVAKARTTLDYGTPVDSAAYSDEIAFLRDL